MLNIKSFQKEWSWNTEILGYLQRHGFSDQDQ